MLCYAMLCYAMLCYAMLCYAMLCYAMLCYARSQVNTNRLTFRRLLHETYWHAPPSRSTQASVSLLTMPVAHSPSTHRTGMQARVLATGVSPCSCYSHCTQRPGESCACGPSDAHAQGDQQASTTSQPRCRRRWTHRYWRLLRDSRKQSPHGERDGLPSREPLPAARRSASPSFGAAARFDRTAGTATVCRAPAVAGVQALQRLQVLTRK